MSQAISNLTPVMDPYDIPQAVKVLDSMSEEVPKASLLYFFSLKLLLNKDKRISRLEVMTMIDNSSGDESYDEREKKENLQGMECFNRLFVVASSF
ncbi:hypothetical protein Golob_026074, partial [Gossypium lobatum]|nr:hypothetical protein [Gossypium lobatum]